MYLPESIKSENILSKEMNVNMRTGVCWIILSKLYYHDMHERIYNQNIFMV